MSLPPSWTLREARKCSGVVEKLAKAGITIIMVEHKMEKMASYCDKLLLLHQGKQVAYDTPERIFSRDDLEELGVKPPVYTQVCKALGVCRRDGEEKLYPVTLEQTQSLRNQFPEALSGRLSAKEEKDEKAQEIFRMEHLGFHYLARGSGNR